MALRGLRGGESAGGVRISFDNWLPMRESTFTHFVLFSLAAQLPMLAGAKVSRKSVWMSRERISSADPRTNTACVQHRLQPGGKGMIYRSGIASLVLCLCGAGCVAGQEPLPLPAVPQAQTQAQDRTQDPAQDQSSGGSQNQAPNLTPAQVQIQTQIQAQIESQIQSQQKSQANGQPALKPNPEETLRNFEPSSDEEYRLGKGDGITVDFAGRPDLLAKLIVGPDGRITLPLAGDILLDGLTRQQSAQAIETALAPYYSNLVVTVTVTLYTANRVVLLGAVDHPGTISFDGTPTLLEALARGGVQAGPDRTGGGPSTQADMIPERCAIYRGNDQVIWVELRKLVETGNALADLRLRRDDVIYVPSNAERFVSVLGQVKNPGAIPLAYNATLASLVASAGGFTEGAGNKPRVDIVTPPPAPSRS